jgi:hypothetical protein
VHERDVVWGCERPELLLTETLAFHDLGTTDEGNADGDLDQKFLPKGSLFFELYNPQSPSEPKPAELYTSSGGVELNRTTAADHPVWRVAVATRGAPVTSKYTYLDPQEPFGGHRGTNALAIERLIYFVPYLSTAGSDGNLPESSAIRSYYPSEATSVSIPPRNYSVVGSASQETIGGTTTVNGVTQLGHLTQAGATSGADARRIVLTPNAGSGNPKVEIYGDATQDDIAAMGNHIIAPTSLRIDSSVLNTTVEPRRLSVSEPVDGYVSTPATWSPEFQENIFDPPRDTPFDLDSSERPDQQEDIIFDDQKNPRRLPLRSPAAIGGPASQLGPTDESVHYRRYSSRRFVSLEWRKQLCQHL